MVMSFPAIHAHRGFSLRAPENTLPAFEAAIEAGADAIEFDLHYTRDSKIVVHHAYFLGKTNNGQGLLAECVFDELRVLDAGHWFHERFSGERIPTLEEVLRVGQNRCKFEIQLCSISRDFIEDVLMTIEDFGVIDDTEITSSFPHVLMQLRQLNPTVCIGVLSSSGPEWMTDELWFLHTNQTLELIKAQVVHIPNRRLQESIVANFKAHGYRTHAADCNTIQDFKNAVKSRVDQFSTDNLLKALEFRDELVYES